jgi:4-hydroxythreonine-4-phosphate dehydrogenase
MAPPIALTQGDPSGIGPELALMAYVAHHSCDLPPFFLLSDPAFIARTAANLALEIQIETTTAAHAGDIFSRALPVVDTGRHIVSGVIGSPDPADAPSTLSSIERAVECVAKGEARAVVTNRSQNRFCIRPASSILDTLNFWPSSRIAIMAATIAR